MDEFDMLPDDEFDRHARRAGEALRRAAPADGMRRVRRTRRRRQLVQVGAAVVAVAVVGGVAALALRSSGDGDLVVGDPGVTNPPASGDPTTTTSVPGVVPDDPANPPVDPSTGSTTTTTTTTTPSPTTTPGTEPDRLGDCLVGDWTIGNDQLGRYFELLAAQLKWLSVDVTGTVDVSFTDTSYRTDSDYELTYVTGGGINSLPESTIVVTFASSSAGTWTALAEQQSVADGVLSSADEQPVGQPDLTINVDGEELTTQEQVGDLLLGVLPRSIVANALFTCDAPALAPELGEFISTGFWSLPLTLTPR